MRAPEEKMYNRHAAISQYQTCAHEFVKCMNHLGKHHWPSWTTHTCFKLVGIGANEVKIMVQLSCVHPGLTLTPSGLNIFTLLGPYFLMHLCIKCKFSSLWIRQGCKWKCFDWFWSCSCWECRSVLKHAWQREIITAYYHIKGATTLVPYLKWSGNFDDMQYLSKMWICVLPFRCVMLGFSGGSQWDCGFIQWPYQIFPDERPHWILSEWWSY